MFGPSVPGVFSSPSPTGKHRLHQTHKPTEALEWAITPVVAGGTVLDPFMGSGSCGEACRHTSRSYIGFELDPAIFETARARLK